MFVDDKIAKWHDVFMRTMTIAFFIGLGGVALGFTSAAERWPGLNRVAPVIFAIGIGSCAVAMVLWVVSVVVIAVKEAMAHRRARRR